MKLKDSVDAGAFPNVTPGFLGNNQAARRQRLHFQRFPSQFIHHGMATTSCRPSFGVIPRVQIRRYVTLSKKRLNERECLQVARLIFPIRHRAACPNRSGRNLVLVIQDGSETPLTSKARGGAVQPDQ